MTGGPTKIRDHLYDALYADLVGPFAGARGHATSRELILQKPTSRYLCGFLVPEAAREPEPDVHEGAGEGDEVASDDAGSEEAEPKQRKLFPASMGMSVLLPAEVDEVIATLSFAQYVPEKVKTEGRRGQGKTHWRRVPYPEKHVPVAVDNDALVKGFAVADVPGVMLMGRVATIDNPMAGLPPGTRALSLFVVNRQPDHDKRDEATLFQVQFAVRCEAGFVARPNLTGRRSKHDFDAQVNDLQFRAHAEYAVGHNVAVEHEPPAETGGKVKLARTRWIPQCEVPLVDARPLDDVTVAMEELAELKTADAVSSALGALPKAYRVWLDGQRQTSFDGAAGQGRAGVRDVLIDEAEMACQRIEAGIALLRDSEEARSAFCLANQAMAMAARRRSPERYEHSAPSWRLFQLAFLLLNLSAMVDPAHNDRSKVELIFFPTGGGKTEAYLGVIAFALLLRRMRGVGQPHQGLGVAVLLRYTLRLLTLDQLERATALICALEVLRRKQPATLGATRFSVGLWVGRSATANRLKAFVDALDDYKNKRIATSPCPIEACPWCKAPLTSASMEIGPSRKKAERVTLRCMNAHHCDFANPHKEGLPLVFIDEQLYRELPSFLIATVDKFAMMPWRGEAGMLFGRANALKGGRFYGPLDKAPKATTLLPDGLPPPEVIVQDELHLINGPLGTMVGLYEIALEQLASRREGERVIKPKIIASTATANHARQQIEALYGQDKTTCIFPPPAVDALETYFSVVNRKDPGRLYVGVAAPGHPLKRILLRTYVSLLCAAKKMAADESLDPDLRDAYMTLVGYFNALRELGGMRRLVEDDVRTQCSNKHRSMPVDGLQTSPWFAKRMIAEPLELTSRESTGRITAAKDRLGRKHRDEQTTDVVLASNMISVGVDIERLGLMVVAGQPKTTSEYIQASSRVGRNRHWPGLVVTCFNVNRARDRSHYEHFVAYHESFYRYVEAQSVTPFAQRALERGLSGALVAAIRLSDPTLTQVGGAAAIAEHRKHAEEVVEAFAGRASESGVLRDWARNRLDIWERMAKSASGGSPRLTYSPYDLAGSKPHLLHTALDDDGGDRVEGEEKFCAPTSMRDVEPTVHIWLSQPGIGKRNH